MSVKSDIKPINLVVILDSSNSMEEKKAETVSKFNNLVSNYIESMKINPYILEKSTISLVSFSFYIHNLLNRMPLNKFTTFKEEEYYTESSSSLNDAICIGIFDYIVDIVDYKYKLYDPDKENVLVIISSGVENSSKKYTHRNVKDLLEFIEDSDGKVIFIGTTLDTMDKGKIYNYDI